MSAPIDRGSTGGAVSLPPRAFVIGHPIAHSRSPIIHGYWLEELGIAGTYEARDVHPDALAGFLRGPDGRAFVGGNVTIPHKEAVFRLVDEASGVARRLGAVNTVTIRPDGALHGHNTDSEGFAAGLDASVGADRVAAVARALVLGAGGAARAVVAALLDRGVGRVLVAARDAARAGGVRDLSPTRVAVVPFGEAAARLAGADLLVNTTSLGMTGQPPLDLDVATLPAHAVVADIVYAPLRTRLLEAAAARGLRTADGLGMLLHQAVPGFERWFGRRPAVTPELRARIVADLARAGPA